MDRALNFNNNMINSFTDDDYQEKLKNINIKLRQDKREQLREMIKLYKLEQ